MKLRYWAGLGVWVGILVTDLWWGLAIFGFSLLLFLLWEEAR